MDVSLTLHLSENPKIIKNVEFREISLFGIPGMCILECLPACYKREQEQKL